ncbi:MAG: hypothetical protein WC560_04555 [Syntrophales bacterium]
MKKSVGVILCALVGLTFFVCSVATADAFELGARGYYWFPTFKSDLRVDNGIVGTEVDAKDTLGVGNEDFPSVEAFAGIGKHHWSIMYTSVDYSGSTTLSQTLIFRGRQYTAGTDVATDIEFTMLDLEYQFDILNLENLPAGFSIGAIGKIKYLDGEAKLNAPSLGFDEKETFQIPLPMVGLGAHVGILADILEARAKITGMSYSGNTIYEGLADVSWTPLPFIDLHGGYKIIKLDVDESGIYLNSEFSGPYLALTVGF